MIETIDNIVQFSVLLVCWLYILWKLVHTKSRQWAPMALCYACYMLATGYWLLYLVLRGHTPEFSYASDFGWYAAALFLCVMLQSRKTTEGKKSGRLIPWLGPLFSAAAFLFFIQWQDYLSNAIAAAVMGCLGWQTLRVLRERGAWRSFALNCLIYYCLEYAMWFSSCYWVGDSLANPYFWIDFLQTLNLIWLLIRYRKTVTA